MEVLFFWKNGTYYITTNRQYIVLQEKHCTIKNEFFRKIFLNNAVCNKKHIISSTFHVHCTLFGITETISIFWQDGGDKEESEGALDFLPSPVNTAHVVSKSTGIFRILK